MSEFMQAVYVTILGMGLVFVSLGALMLIIMALQYVLRERRTLAVAPAGAALPPVPFRLDADLSPPAGEPTASEEVVAAIAVALAVWRAQQEAAEPPQTTVVTFAPGSPAWRALGRLS